MSNEKKEIALRQNEAVLPTAEKWNQVKEMANYFHSSNMLGNNINKPGALLLLMRGHDLGIPLTTALTNIYPIPGKGGRVSLTCSAELMLSYIKKDVPGFRFTVIESSEKRAAIKFSCEYIESAEIEYTIEQAKIAGLLGKDNWKNYPADMLWARMITRLKRRFFPEVLNGMSHCPEEVGADVDENGIPSLKELKKVTETDVEPEVAPVDIPTNDLNEQAADAPEPEKPAEEPAIDVSAKKTTKKKAAGKKTGKKKTNTLPEESAEAQPEPPADPNPDQTPAEPDPVSKISKAELQKMVVTQRENLCWTHDQLTDFIKKEFNKTSGELEVDDLEKLLIRMEEMETV